MSTMVPNNSNAYSAWKAGAIAGTNIDPCTNWLEIDPNTLSTLLGSQFPNITDVAVAYGNAKASPLAQAYGTQWYHPSVPTYPLKRADILKNLALKGGLNAIRIMFPFRKFQNGSVIEHDIKTIARVGWEDTNIDRSKDAGSSVSNSEIIPRYNILAAQITNLLALSQQLGLGVILCVPMSTLDQSDLWLNQNNFQDDLVNFWAKTAQKWKGFPALIGYEIINEPSPPLDATQTPPLTYSTMRAANGFLPLMNRCIAAIRKLNATTDLDTVTPIIVSSPAGSSIFAFDFFLSSSSQSTDKLFSGEKLVYTCHAYAPANFAQQGIEGSYLSLGLCYPSKLYSRKHDPVTGLEIPKATDDDFHVVDFTTNGPTTGMSALFENVKIFQDRFSLPVFLGEFGASSSRYYQRIVERDANISSNLEAEDGPFSYAKPNGPERQIVGLLYSPVRHKGYIILKNPVHMDDRNGVDEFNLACPVNTVDIQIKAATANGVSIDIGIFDGLKIADAKIQGLRRWITSATQTVAAGHDENFYIEFPWPWPPGTNVPPQAYGCTSQWGSYYDEHNVRIFKNPSLIPEDDVISPPSGFRAAINGGQVMGVDGQQDILSAIPSQIASLKIILSNEQVKKQEASRVAFTKDVLKQCAAQGMSWAWYQDTCITKDYLWGDQFFRVDAEIHAPTETGGKLRAVLKNASNQLIA